MTTETITIQIREDGSRVVSRNIEDIGKSAKKSDDGVAMLKRTLAGLGGLLAVNQLRHWLDSWTTATGIVNIFTKSAEQTSAIMDRLYQIAQNTRQPIDATAQSYHQMSIAATALGASQDQLLQFTENVNKALAIAKTPASTARGGIIQLGQAMNEGIVRGQEYNAMINSMPIVLQTVAKNWKTGAISLGQLRQMMLAGKLTSKDFFEALLRGSTQLDEMFQKSGKTIGQALTVLDNSMTRLVGKMGEVSGVTEGIFTVAKYAADHIENLAKAFVTLASPAILLGVMRLGTALKSIFMQLAVWAAANPILAIIGAVTAAITALVLWRDQIILVQEGQVSLGDYMRASWDMIKGAASDVAVAFNVKVLPAIKAVAESVGLWIPSWSDVTNAIKGYINTIIGFHVGLMRSIAIAIAGVPDAFKDVFTRAANWAIEAVNSAMGGIVNAFNSLADFAGWDKMTFKPFETLQNDAAGAASQMTNDIKAAWADSMNQDYVGMLSNKAFSTLNKKAREYADIRNKEKPAIDLSHPSGAGDPVINKNAAKEAEKLREALRRLEDQYKPSIGAALDMAKATKTLDRALAAGMIDQQTYNDLIAAMKLHYEDIINPIGAYIRKQEQELNGLKSISSEQAVSNEVYKFTMDMRKQGITVTDQQTAAIRANAQAIEYQRGVQQQLNQIYDETTGKQLTLTQTQQAIQQAYAAGYLSLDQYNIKMNQLAVTMANFKAQQGDGSFENMMTASLGRLVENYQGVAAGMTTAFGDFFKSFTDGFADSVGHAIVYSDNLGDALRNVAQEAISALISALIKLGIQYAINAALGTSLGTAALAASTAAGAASATALAAAYAPAAAMASLASFGANAAPAMAGITATTALSSSLAAAGKLIAGFEEGGYTGNMATNEVAGVVHGKEFVFDAGATSRIGVDNLEKLRSGKADMQAMSGGNGGNGAGVVVNLTVVNNSDGSKVSATKQEDDQGNVDLKVTIDNIESTLAARVQSGRGPLHKATKTAFGLTAKPTGG